MKCEILLSTYNGEKYLEEQLNSLKNQTIEIHITARDDGSEDSTETILQSVNGIEIIKGENVGATESFLQLIDAAPESDYYAFCDQDDVWDVDKIECAILKLMQHDSIPAIYSSNTRLVDDKLTFIKNERKKPITSLGSAIVKNYATGCTVVFNKKLMHELKKYHPVSVPFHDWWANLVCLSLDGISIFDANPHIKYRQHGKNVVSGNVSFKRKWKSRIKKFNNPYHRDQMAKQLLYAYSNSMPESNKIILNNVALGKYDKNQRSGNIVDDILYRFCLLCRKY